jgi:hypothetical protein
MTLSAPDVKAVTTSYVERVHQRGITRRFTPDQVMKILDAFLTTLGAGENRVKAPVQGARDEQWRTLFVANVWLYGAGIRATSA